MSRATICISEARATTCIALTRAATCVINVSRATTCISESSATTCIAVSRATTCIAVSRAEFLNNVLFLLAQLVERRLQMRDLRGSNPIWDIAFFRDNICCNIT
jgi:hypothetical protein